MPPLAVYIHVPFCIRKCNYCDFYSLAAQPEDMGAYVEALRAEIAREGERLDHPPVATVYLGGGTPSLLPPRLVERVLEALRQHFQVSPQAEVTMEANPGTVSYTAWKSYINLGINRISLGVQSLDDNMLRVLGRLHSVEDVYGAVTALRRMGFENYNLDMIYGIPGQSKESLARELVLLQSFLGRHLSAYSLQVEENTPLYELMKQGRMHKPGEDVEADMYEMIQEVAAAQGLTQYELSNWACPGFQCRHNLAYWQTRPYLGLGAGAVSRLGKRRYQNQPDLVAYITGAQQGITPRVTLEELDEREMVRETLVMGLRLTDGVPLAQFTARFGHDIDFYYPHQIEEAEQQGLLEQKDGYLRLTPRAYLIANQVLCRF